MNPIGRAAILDELKRVLRDTLQLGPRAASLTEKSQLLGTIPELDSMAVVVVMTAVEERFGFAIADDEVSAETFATLGSLTDFVDAKLRS
jgi:acyl carrier protein